MASSQANVKVGIEVKRLAALEAWQRDELCCLVSAAIKRRERALNDMRSEMLAARDHIDPQTAQSCNEIMDDIKRCRALLQRISKPGELYFVDPPDAPFSNLTDQVSQLRRDLNAADAADRSAAPHPSQDVTQSLKASLQEVAAPSASTPGEAMRGSDGGSEFKALVRDAIRSLVAAGSFDKDFGNQFGFRLDASQPLASTPGEAMRRSDAAAPRANEASRFVDLPLVITGQGDARVERYPDGRMHVGINLIG